MHAYLHAPEIHPTLKWRTLARARASRVPPNALGGVAHFVATQAEISVVPTYIPWPRGVVLASGVFELLGAAGLLLRATRRAAGIGLFALTIAVTPVHIYMLQHADLLNVPYWALVLRLPLQLALLVLIAWSTMRR